MNQFKKTTKNREKLRGIYFQVGLIIAGGLTLVAFEWTSPININELPDYTIIYQEEWDLPVILPEPEIIRPEVKFTTAPKKSETFIIVEKIIDPVVEPTPEPTPEPKFDPNTWEPEPYVDPNPAPVPFAEVMPEFKGGIEKLFEYLGKNIKYPNRDKNNGMEGTVYLQFVVGKKGEIKNIKILRGVTDLMDKEAIRVLKAMPKWTPGKQSGRPVSVIYNLPIKFQLKG
ncbi:MAG: energy transducer TonB [Flavobacteriales bacterium]|nr:energy transducer TonB [Flavobacteriales bacterium]NQX99323.1 energy transducer TonB [Flavobacteriales bacterium]